MSQITLADVNASTIPSDCGLCPGDPRVAQWLNLGVEILLKKGRWWGTMDRINICVSGSCITLPRRYATIEAISQCGAVIQNHDFWWEFLESRGGECDSCWNECNAKGRFPTFSDVIGLDKKLSFACDLSADVGVQVLVLGYDQNFNWIRTQQNGVWMDGELVTLAQGTGTLTANLYSSIKAIQLPGTRSGQVFLYEYSTTTLAYRLIGQYQHDETRPNYARYSLPGLKYLDSVNTAQPPAPANRLCGCQLSTQQVPQTFPSCLNGCLTPNVKVEALVKLEFVPVVNPNDYVLIGNIPALSLMMVAIKKSREVDDALMKFQILEAGQMAAAARLDEELDHYLGAGQRRVLNFYGSSAGSIDPVPNLL